MNPESVLFFVLLLVLSGVFTLTVKMQGQRSYLRSLDKKLDALLKAQGIEWLSLSPEVQRLALDPSKRILAIKLHRDENPDMSLAEAKGEIEAWGNKVK